jgi:hypothetical protein
MASNVSLVRGLLAHCTYILVVALRCAQQLFSWRIFSSKTCVGNAEIVCISKKVTEQMASFCVCCGSIGIERFDLFQSGARFVHGKTFEADGRHFLRVSRSFKTKLLAHYCMLTHTISFHQRYIIAAISSARSMQLII